MLKIHQDKDLYHVTTIIIYLHFYKPFNNQTFKKITPACTDLVSQAMIKSPKQGVTRKIQMALSSLLWALQGTNLAKL